MGLFLCFFWLDIEKYFVLGFVCTERIYMKFVRILIFSLFLMPVASFAAGSDFMLAAQLLAAAKAADIQQVQSLVNNGADVNFVDSTGVSIVCTALMNNDVRAAQILQMYGADASQCDRQIKQYNKKNKPKTDSGGLFSGLSSAQGIALAAAGAAVVVGGLFLLTDVLDPGNDNDSGSAGGDRPNNNPDNGEGGGGASNEAFAKLPYGPACDPVTGVCNNVNDWSPSGDSVRAQDFAVMKPWNYLLMTFAYNALARGYLGQDTVRITSDKTPYDLGDLPWVGDAPGGGQPVNVAIITENGVNPSGSLADGYIDWVDESQINRVQSVCKQYGSAPTNCKDALANATKISRKFANRTNMNDLNDVSEQAKYDFSGHGTVFGDASALESLTGKVVAGWEYGGRATGDFYGFVPNGTLAVFRTGGGWGVDVNVGTVTHAVDASAWTVDDTFTVAGTTYKITELADGAFSAVNVADETQVLAGKQNGLVLNFNVNDVQYEADFNGAVNSLKQIDVMNYSAMLAAAQDKVDGAALSGVIANIAQNPQSTNANYLNLNGIANLVVVGSTDADKKSIYAAAIDTYYDLDKSNNDTVNTQGDDADELYEYLGNNQEQIIVNSVGAYKVGIGEGMSTETLVATFENYAPLLYPNMEHLFASVVAVQTQKGTSAISSISSYSGPNSTTGKIQLSQWNGFSSRKCGTAGLAVNGVDPWCFAAPGVNSETAVAAMAGGIATVQTAFSYLSNKEVFALLALTADGAYLGTNPSTGRAWADQAELVSYLQGKYQLPADSYYVSNSEYLDAFKDVFGYGLINLERATRPGTTIYYYDGNNIVSGDGNAYWRAATNTVFRGSSVLNLRGAEINVPFFDVLSSVDGEMVLPRVWNNHISLGNADERGLYMGDVLGELQTKKSVANRTKIGSLGVKMSFAQRSYDDNMNGLDNLVIEFDAGKWDFAASYQHHLTDGASQFDGLANPVLAMASNAVVSDVMYRSGKWMLGGRVFSGTVTDEGLMENDPTIASQYMPAKLGLMQGAQAHTGWANDKFAFTATIGNAHETDTLLGAQSDGLLSLGAGDTTYVDALAQYRVNDMIDLTARATFARTVSDASGMVVMGLTDINSNAFAFGANVGNFEFSVSQPLAITDGALQYAYAEYDVVENANGGYELNVVDTHVADLSLRPDMRELRLAGTYRHQFGEFTDGAIGFIYRVNPNHTDDFGNESIFMMKLHHRLGI